jgi:hypothetical protein
MPTDAWPTDELKSEAAKSPDKKTLLELIEKLTAEAPSIDDDIADLPLKYPEIVGPDVKDPIHPFAPG